jgi:hypothetical protein
VLSLTNIRDTLIRLEEFAPSIAYRSDRLRTDLASFGPVEILDDTHSRLAWTAIRDCAPFAAAVDQESDAFQDSFNDGDEEDGK